MPTLRGTACLTISRQTSCGVEIVERETSRGVDILRCETNRLGKNRRMPSHAILNILERETSRKGGGGGGRVVCHVAQANPSHDK